MKEIVLLALAILQFALGGITGPTASGGSSAPTLVGTPVCVSEGGSGSGPYTYTAPYTAVAAGDSIVAAIAGGDVNTASSITDSRGDAGTLPIIGTGYENPTVGFIHGISSGVSSIKFVLTSQASTTRICVTEWSGLNSIGNTAKSSSSTYSESLSVTQAGGYALGFGFSYTTPATSSLTASSGILLAHYFTAYGNTFVQDDQLTSPGTAILAGTASPAVTWYMSLAELKH